MSGADLLGRIERYYDAALRPLADPVEVGPLTLFVSRGEHSYYARPRLDSGAIGVADVTAMLERQDELGVPRSLEWVHEVTPDLLAAATGAGLVVERCPLLVLEGRPPAPSSDVRLVGADDPALALVTAAVHVGFGHAGTASGAAGLAERDAAATPRRADRTAAAIAAGHRVMVAAHDGDAGPVGGGTHNPRAAVPDVSEIVGVAVLPAYRRRGLAAAMMAALSRHALDHGVTTVFCSAQDDDVARVYAGVGFRRIGTACIVDG